jgi:RNA polymerase sigma-70 factor (ECF subfamily)
VLPEQQRRCLILVARDGLSYREAADLLGLSALTVRNHLAAARRRLRAELEGGEPVRTTTT